MTKAQILRTAQTQHQLAMEMKVPQVVTRSRPFWLTGRAPQYLAAIVVNLSAFSYGTCMGWSSAAVPVLTTAGYSEESLSWATGAMFLGCGVGSVLFGLTSEWWGRRLTGLVVAVPVLLGWVGLLGDWGVETLVTARTVMGLGLGGVIVICPMYVGEVVEDCVRGLLGSFFPLFLNAGILFAYAVGPQVSLSSFAVVCGVIPAAYIALFALFPETPAYLLSRGRDTAALESLAWLRDPRHVDVAAELTALRVSQKRGEAEESAAGLRDLFATRGARRGTTCFLGLLTLQQFGGITAVIAYAADIFKAAGSSLDPSAAACVIGALQLVGSVAACFLMDRAGRRPLLYVSYACMCATLFMLGACFCWPSALPGWLPVLCLSIFIFTYALGSGPIPFVLIMEVLPSRLRSVASQLGMVVLFILAFVVSKFFGQLSAFLGTHGCFWLFSVGSALAIVFTWFLVPETKGKSVDMILVELEGRRTPSEHSMDELRPREESV